MKESTPKIFIGFQGPLDFYENIKDGSVTLERAEKETKRIYNRSKYNIKRKT